VRVIVGEGVGDGPSVGTGELVGLGAIVAVGTGIGSPKTIRSAKRQAKDEKSNARLVKMTR